jgi:S-adenosylmethionine-diacylgycerolhomoserine-N-methlytransferase
VLEVGCGTGRNLIAAARRYPSARLYGVDISPVMLATARAHVERAGLAERIVLAEGDAADFDAADLFDVARFDRVFFSYALSMIPPWRQALETGAAHLAPGGSLHVVDFGDQQNLPGWFTRPLNAWLGAFHVAPRHELEAELRAAASTVGGTVDCDAFYRGYSVLGRIALG